MTPTTEQVEASELALRNTRTAKDQAERALQSATLDLNAAERESEAAKQALVDGASILPLWLQQWPLEPLRKAQREMGEYERGWNEAITAAGERLDALARGESA